MAYAIQVQLCHGQSATLMHSAGAADIFNRLLSCARPCNSRCSRCRRFDSSSRIGSDIMRWSICGLQAACLTCVRLRKIAWPVCNMFDVHRIETKVPCHSLACLQHVWRAQNRNQSALPDSAPAEHSGWHDEASELLRCVSVHIVFDLVRTVRQCLFTCCHVWTCCCCSRITHYPCAFGFRRQAFVYAFIFTHA